MYFKRGNHVWMSLKREDTHYERCTLREEIMFECRLRGSRHVRDAIRERKLCLGVVQEGGQAV